MAIQTRALLVAVVSVVLQGRAAAASAAGLDPVAVARWDRDDSLTVTRAEWQGPEAVFVEADANRDDVVSVAEIWHWYEARQAGGAQATAALASPATPPATAPVEVHPRIAACYEKGRSAPGPQASTPVEASPDVAGVSDECSPDVPPGTPSAPVEVTPSVAAATGGGGPPVPAAGAMADRWLARFDADRDGCIDKAEWSSGRRPAAKSRFGWMDRDADGKLTRAELVAHGVVLLERRRKP